MSGHNGFIHAGGNPPVNPLNPGNAGDVGGVRPSAKSNPPPQAPRGGEPPQAAPERGGARELAGRPGGNPVHVPVLHVDATVRPESRTAELARWLLGRMGGATETVRLAAGAAAPLDGPALQRREALLAAGRLDEPEFALARQFAAAERIVVAAPYWDLLFPASLRAYFERVCVVGVTFRYDGATGAPVSLCRARSLVYVCTAGGPVDRNLGFEYVRALCGAFFGIPDVRLLQADGLDLPGADVPALLARAKAAWA